MVMAQAQAVAYNDVFRLCAVVFICSLPSIFLLGKPKPAETAEPVAVE
jgi:hypothetical protein